MTAMPRTPAVYERKTRWKKYGDDDRKIQPEWRDNYPAVTDAINGPGGLKEQFETEIKEDRMVKVSDKQLR